MVLAVPPLSAGKVGRGGREQRRANGLGGPAEQMFDGRSADTSLARVVEVLWPDGRRSAVKDQAANREIAISAP
jgi:hypothetical protein